MLVELPTIGLAEYGLQVNFFQDVEPDQRPLSKRQLFPVFGRSFTDDGAHNLEKFKAHYLITTPQGISPTFTSDITFSSTAAITLTEFERTFAT